MNRMALRLLVAATTVIATGCGGAAELVLDELSEGEARQLAEAVMFATFNSTSVIPPAPEAVTRPGSRPGGWAMNFEAEVKCPSGGVVGLASSIVVAEDSSGDFADYRMVQVHNECAMGSDRAGDFTLWGSPRMEASVSVHHAPSGVVQWTGSTAGSVEWAAGGREGECAFDLAFTGRQEGIGSPGATVVGTVCGYSLSDPFSFE